MTGYVTHEQRRELVGTGYSAKLKTGEVRPAQVNGHELQFARVTVEGLGTAEYAWGTVARVAAQGGQFKIQSEVF